MKPWLHRHRRGVCLIYVAIASTATFVLQLLETQGVFK